VIASSLRTGGSSSRGSSSIDSSSGGVIGRSGNGFGTQNDGVYGNVHENVRRDFDEQEHVVVDRRRIEFGASVSNCGNNKSCQDGVVTGAGSRGDGVCAVKDGNAGDAGLDLIHNLPLLGSKVVDAHQNDNNDEAKVVVWRDYCKGRVC